ncbi:MAG: deoxyribose-phosphate aldolase [Kiritimatiellae bacterium]|nr:deoxyribose-phosphate aldolase [Kiritimatiellia bacterium]
MYDVETITPAELAGMIDHTFLKPFGGPEPIEKLCAEAREYGFAMVAINPSEIARCAFLLRGSKVRVGAAISFPLGQMTSAAKAFEIRDAIDKGAGEIDMVQNVRALQEGNDALVFAELKDMADVCRARGVISKVILETCYLTDEQKVRTCELAVRAGVDFVKTSTGFGTAGATAADIALMRRTVGPKMGVKAAGGIRTLESAFEMIRAGATRIGTSAGVAIVEELKKLRLNG